MHVETHDQQDDVRIGRRLTGIYARCLLWYVLAICVLWIMGLEGIYYHPTPFYGLLLPVPLTTLLPRLLFPGAVFAAGLTAWWVAARRCDWFAGEPSSRFVKRFLLALIVFSILFSIAVAMMRDGLEGVSGAYQRPAHEYIGDIGKGMSIQGLFRDYMKMHPHLSMHSKVHPPGAAALLWLISLLVFSQDPLVLSLATIVGGSLAIIPLYLWTSDMTSKRVALTCATLYALIPTVVIFTATSTDILFTPFTMTTLFLFWRAIHRRSIAYAICAGVMYAFISLISFSLIGLGAFFGFVGLWRMREKQMRLAVVQTAAVMILSFLSVHMAVRWWSGFDVIECFRVCKDQFDLDQANLDLVTPRFPSWTWKLLNPACWLFFAGIPVSVLCIWRIARPEASSRALFIVFALTLLVLDMLYLARGEGERSAMYIIPFMALPAAHVLDQMGRAAGSRAPVAATLAFLAFQCILIESIIYTYW